MGILDAPYSVHRSTRGEQISLITREIDSNENVSLKSWAMLYVELVSLNGLFKHLLHFSYSTISA